MKTQFLLGLVFLCLNFKGFTQTIPAYDPATDATDIAYQNRMSAIFENVDLTQVPSGILYERGFPFIAIEAFTGKLADSTSGNSMAFGLAYASITTMIVDSTMVLPNPIDYTAVFDAVTPNSSVIPILGMHQVYHSLDTAALDDSLFILVDSNLVDVPGRSRSPYIQNELFLFSPVTQIVNQPTFSLNFDSNRLYSNTGKTVQSLEIDFSNGQGYLAVNFDENIPVVASEVGRMIFKVKLTYTDSSVYYTRFDIIATRSTSMLSVDDAPDVIYDIPAIATDSLDPSTGRGGGSINVFLACGHERIEKPFIWAEAYNPAIGIIQADLNAEIILERIDHPDGEVNDASLLQYLTENGYDIIVLDYDIGTDYLPRTAEFIKEAIRWVNIQKASGSTRAKNVILGQSMGGVATMQALREMENTFEDHECEKFIIFDSPIRGVNIPLSAQASLLDIASMNVNVPFGGDEGALHTFVPPIQDILNLYYAPATQTMMTERCPTIRDETDGVDYDFHLYFAGYGYKTEHLYADHYNYLHGAMGGMPEDCEVIAIANGSQAITPALGSHNFSAGEKVIDINADHFAIGTIIAGLLPELIDNEFISGVFDTEEVKSAISLILWESGRSNIIDINLYAMKNSTDFKYYNNNSKVTFLPGLINIVQTNRSAYIDNGLEVDNAPGGFFGLKNQGIFFPDSVGGVELEDVVDDFKMHTWCFTPTGSVLNFYDPSTSGNWKSNLYRAYNNPNYDITNNYTQGINMYHANRFNVTFDADPIDGREYANTGHTWFTSDQSMFLLYFLIGNDDLDGIYEITDEFGSYPATYNYGKSAILPSSDFEGDIPIRTSSVLDHSLTVDNTRLSVNANEAIGLSTSPLDMGTTENGSHFVMLLGNICDASPTVTLEITNDGEFDIGHYGTGRTGTVLVQSGHDLVVKSGGVVTVNPWSTLKLNSGGDIHIEDGGKLIIENYGSFITESGSTIHIYEGGEIEFKGNNALIDIGGNLHLHENAVFNPTHVGVSSGKVIWNSAEGGIIASPGSKFWLIGDGSSDPLLTINEGVKLIAPNTLDQFLLASCQVLFRSEEDFPLQVFAPFKSSNVSYEVQDNLETALIHPIVACFNKSLITSSEFIDVCLQAEEIVDIDGYFLHVVHCDFDLTYTKSETPLTLIGGNISLSFSDFTGFAGNALKMDFRTSYSSIYNSTFTSNGSPVGEAILDASTSELFVKNCTFTNGLKGITKHYGQLTLRCNSFNDLNDWAVYGGGYSRVEMSANLGAGYNTFSDIGINNVVLDQAQFLSINGGYNYFDYNGSSSKTVQGTFIYDLPDGLLLPGFKNQWNPENIVPVDGFEITHYSSGSPIIYSRINPESKSCGVGSPSVPIYDVPGGGGNYFPEITITGESNALRLDSAISKAFESSSAWDSTANDLAAIQQYHDILTHQYTQAEKSDTLIQYFLNIAFQQMKHTVGRAVMDSVILKSQNQSSFSTPLQQYVDVLNLRSQKDTFSLYDYADRFYLELDKAHLFRMLGHTQTGLDILQNLNLCNLDSTEQVVLNDWMFVYEEQLAKQNIGFEAYGIDTVYTDTSGYQIPTSTQAIQFTFGSVINSLTSINYRSCSGSLKPEEDETIRNSSFTIYPNPSDGIVNLKYQIPSEKKAELIVYSINGQVIYRAWLIEGANTATIDLSNVESGLYLYTVMIEGAVEHAGRISIAK